MNAAGANTFTTSPRMRGTRERAGRMDRPRRFIPAHAGNTRRFSQPRGRTTVHPRACGEHFGTTIWETFAPGSSPRMRGTLKRSWRRLHAKRFIPAHAGNTSGCGRWRAARPVHPRACGEHSSSVHPRACGEHPCETRADPQSCGSSPRMRGTPPAGVPVPRLPRFIPRMRGTQCHPGDIAGRRRFIPAHAGNTRKSKTQARHVAGSSPRMRGTRDEIHQQAPHGRFIPAHAGNTGGRRCRPSCHPVHPRACGEHPVLVFPFFICKRFIPAHAGNTLPGSFRRDL